MIFKPHHAAFTVANIDDSVQWYKTNLDFKLVHKHELKDGTFVILKKDLVRIELFNFGQATKPLPKYRHDLMKDLHVQGMKHLCIEVEDLDQLIAELNAKSIETRPVDTAGFGGRFTFIKDPNGILIEFYQK